ncbi:cellulose synthase-like protein E6 isoform X1 [Neltuma alba]|uniref:cellulose synthase-like protein E6 isoform X1 n=1 Tax=Neltuma alba TaxID=207710 RepID=UPI0010A55BF0|nr:cellulose synthase-like protein E6 isoform X1 [Prosopis alba]
MHHFCRIRKILLSTEGGGGGGWVNMGVMMSEMCFGVFWIFTQSVRWTLVHHSPFKHILSRRYDEEKLPGVDIFVCTADPTLEPPSMVMNTVLSAMSYNYPSSKLSIYVSDDGGSELTFYALLRASLFSKHWIPFCKRFNIQTRSPQAYFSSHHSGAMHQNDQQWSSIKKLYEDMKSEIESVVEKGKIPNSMRNQHRGLSEWNYNTTKQNHQPIVQVQIIIDGRDTNAIDDDGFQLPTLVYMAREKRPNFPHHFKAGAMNALIRVSLEISNGPIILNLDCDMYPNSADTIQEALCFFIDETRGHQIAYVQFPQRFNNITKNDLYSNAFLVGQKIELAGFCGNGGSLYCGTGCFHRRESLSGMHFKNYYKPKWDTKPKTEDKRTADELIEVSKALVSCTYEDGTQWGKEMGLVYGIPVEDIVTGLAIICRGWKSIYYNPPERNAFMGVAPTTFDMLLVQHKRWGQGLSQILFSKYCPFIHGHNKLSFGLQMAYSVYLLWVPLSLPTLCYLILLPISTFRGIPLFPQLTSPWIIPFLYAFLANYAYSFLEALSCGNTAKAWWNTQRMTLFRRTTSYLFGFIDTISLNLNLSQTKFDVTDKVLSQDTLDCYEREVLYFGSSSVMFTIMATLALLNLFGAIWGIKRLLVDSSWSHLGLQIVLCFLIMVLNKPIYEALFIRTDRGSLPSKVLFKSIVLASLGCTLASLIC